MTRSPSLAALTRRRFATPRSAAAVIVVLTMLAAFAIAAAPRALVGVVRAEVAHQLGATAPTSRDLTGTALDAPVFGPGTPGEGWDAGADTVFGALNDRLIAARESFSPVLRDLTAPASFAQSLQTAVFVAPGGALPEPPEGLPLSRLEVMSAPDAFAALTLVDGAWPGDVGTGEGGLLDEVPIVLSAEAAEVMGWPIGEVRRIPASAARPALGWIEEAPRFVLTGIVTAADPDADRWQHLPTALAVTVFDDGNARPQATSGAWVSAATWEALYERLGGVQTTIWYPVDAAGARGADPHALLASLRAATTASLALDDAGLRMRLSTELVTVMGTALARANSASAILAVAAVGPLAVSVALIVLASSLIVRRRRTDLVLLTARGAPLPRLRRLLFGEGALLGLPAAAIGTGVGVLVTPGDAGIAPTVLAVLVGFAPAVALASALTGSLLSRERSDLDVPVRGRWVRILEILVVLLAVLAVIQLLLRGIGTDTAGIDPMVVVAPLLVTVALALVVVRLHPLPIAAAYTAARRRTGVVSLVGSARTLRNPAAGTTAVLAMVVAVAIAVFSSVILATVDRGAVVAAQRDVGADIRIAGPYIDEAGLDRIRAVEGVADAVGVMRGDYLPVTGSAGRESVLSVVTDTAALAAVQRGFVAPFPAEIAPGADPVDVILSATSAEAVGAGPLTVYERPAEAVGSLDTLAGFGTVLDFVIMDAADYTAIRGLGFHPRIVLADLAPGADPHAVAVAVDAAVGIPHSTRILVDSTAEIQASPAVSALRFVLLAAIAVAALLSVIALLLVAGVSRDARSRVIAMLRTMGLDRRRARGIVAWEFVPLGVTALVGGVLLGVALPLLVVSSIDLRPFTGGGAQPQLVVDPMLSGALLAVVVGALAIAVVAGVLSARTTSMATVLRTEED